MNFIVIVNTSTLKKKKNTENYSLMKQFAVKLQQIKGHDLGHESYGLIACHF